ncbi:L-proline glycine betaine binding ABC transporter protein ProX (TC 3.A.1.12.1) / Osmotic adaptation [Caballeronia glathei]|jgi:glycine betaine/proline transport system substrate-binding protein|uniref:Glycine/betaine ABC transporter substrate-binding protein n=1 Tax=Caballeronia glathei TaxID=60547 RepID=A0A069PN91_9BURK|nr:MULTISPECIES: glycine betaine ABC transporter substrate-binding protein [Burkholderiaceae]KDR38766.1 glycine/betaine ABC transporter substrate-binding protein [Caballeronia glathei]TCK35271.1 glycine betaine/proline transport system substrate-binding protein [Paraburkholderia sp. BL8N3]CDY74792.1 L-proline glycine betaine binding ABC transporter protein ProX (TC 3.A.1.12.1) / Osmotic adaptation [Caballeronia glathei]
MTKTGTLVMSTIDLSFHHAAAGVVTAILEKHGVHVIEHRAPHEEAFHLLADGTADMLCSAWLPGSHGIYFDPLAHQFENLSVLYSPYALWGVPDYVPPDAVSTVADLKKPEVVARMRKHIQGIGPGAGISRFSREILALYDLNALGYTFSNGALDECVSAFEDAVSKREWAVVPPWQPQYLLFQTKIRELAEPHGLLRGKDEATLILRKSRLNDLPADAIAELRETSLGDAEVTQLDHLISREGVTPTRAGRDYLSRHGKL